MRHSFHSEQWLPYPIEQVFQFFSDPENLPLLMRGWQRARVDNLTIVPPAGFPTLPFQAAGSGSVVGLSFRPFRFLPMRLRWAAEIVEFKWNERFCDRQVKGPFAYWHHCHYLRSETRAGVAGTLIADDLEYEWSQSLWGPVVNRLFLRAQLKRLFAFRQRRLEEILGRKRP